MKKYILGMLLVIGNEFANSTQYQNASEKCPSGYYGVYPDYVTNASGIGEDLAVYCVKNGSYYQGVYAG